MASCRFPRKHLKRLVTYIIRNMQTLYLFCTNSIAHWLIDVSHVTTAFWRNEPLAGQQTRWQMRFRSSDPLKNTVQKQQHAENIQTSILTRWSVAVRWSHLNRTPEDGSSSPPAPHTLSCSLAGNIQSHCETQEKLVWRILSNLLRQN